MKNILKKDNYKTYNYHYETLTDTKSFKVRKYIRLCILISMFCILSIFTYINIARYNNLKKTNEVMTMPAHDAFVREEKKIIKKADIILNSNSSKYTQEEMKLIKENVSDLKENSIKKDEIIKKIWNTKKEYNYTINLTYNFIQEYDNKVGGIDIDSIYEILKKYKPTMNDNRVEQIRSRRSATHSFDNFKDYYDNNKTDFIILNKNYFYKEKFNISDAILLLVKENNNLLNDIIEVGEISE